MYTFYCTSAQACDDSCIECDTRVKMLGAAVLLLLHHLVLCAKLFSGNPIITNIKLQHLHFVTKTQKH